MIEPDALPTVTDTGAATGHPRKSEFLLDMPPAGVEDFVRAVFDDPSILERLPRGGEEPPHIVCVGEGVPPVDLDRYAGKTLYVHELRPGARERFEAALAQVRDERRDAAAD